MNKLIIAVTVFISAFAQAAEKKSIEVNCPPSIRVNTKLLGLEKGWEYWDVAEEGKSAIKPLKSIGIYEGHPGHKVLLAPDNKDSKDNFWKWTIAPFGESRKKPIWVGCHYDETQVLTGQSIGLRLQTCRMEFRTEVKGNKLGPIVCE